MTKPGEPNLMLTRKPVFLHIGFPKTGSTALQTNFFMKHPELYYLGKPLTLFNQDVDDLIRNIKDLETIAWFRRLEDFLRVSSSLFQQRYDHVLISEEEFSVGSAVGGVDRATIAQRLSFLFPNARILVVIRNQLSALASLYTYSMTLPQSRLVPFNDWLRLLRSSLPFGLGLQLLDYASLLDRYANLFNRDRIHVLTFEEYRAEPRRFIGRLASILGVDRKIALSLPNKRLNVRPSSWTIRASQLRDGFPSMARAFLALPFPLRARFISMMSRGEPPDTTYAADNEAFARAYFSPGNRCLRNEYGLDLEGLGYPL